MLRATRAWGLFLKSSETFRAYFRCHNFLYIFATSRFQLRNPLGFSFIKKNVQRSAFQNKWIAVWQLAIRARPKRSWHFWEEGLRWPTVPHHSYSRWRLYPSVFTMKLSILRLCPRGAMLWIKEALLSVVNLSVSGFNNMLRPARGERHAGQCTSSMRSLTFTEFTFQVLSLHFIPEIEGNFSNTKLLHPGLVHDQAISSSDFWSEIES